MTKFCLLCLDKWYINICDLSKTNKISYNCFLKNILKYWLVVLTIMKTFETCAQCFDKIMSMICNMK